MSTVQRPSTSRKPVRTLHTEAIARERARKEAARKATLPPWFAEVSEFLRRLGLDGHQLASVCAHLDRTRSAQGCPVLRPNDAAVLAGIIARNGQQAPQPPRQAVASPPPVETPTASTPFTPRPLEAYEPSPQDWADYAEWSRSLDTPTAIARPAADDKPVKVSSVRSSTKPPAWTFSPDQARYIGAYGPGHYA